MDVDIRWPGGSIKTYQIFFVPGMDEVGTVLLGDPAYPLLPHVMKEYAQC